MGLNFGVFATLLCRLTQRFWRRLSPPYARLRPRLTKPIWRLLLLPHSTHPRCRSSQGTTSAFSPRSRHCVALRFVCLTFPARVAVNFRVSFSGTLVWVGWISHPRFLNVVAAVLVRRWHVPTFLDSRVYFFCTFWTFFVHIFGRDVTSWGVFAGALLHGASVGGVRVST